MLPDSSTRPSGVGTRACRLHTCVELVFVELPVEPRIRTDELSLCCPEYLRRGVILPLLPGENADGRL